MFDVIKYTFLKKIVLAFARPLLKFSQIYDFINNN